MTVQGYRVFDGHIHVERDDFLRPAARATYSERPDAAELQRIARDPQLLVARLDAAGVDRAAIITYGAPHVMGFTHRINDWVADYTAEHRDRLVPVGGITPTTAEETRREAARVLDDLGLAAMKLHPPHQEVDPLEYQRDTERGRALAALYAACEERGKPLIVHTGTSVFPGARSRLGDPMALDDVAIDHPDLALVVAHAGRPLWCDGALFIARRHPNVWLDVSGIPPHRLLHYLPQLEKVAHKTLWGTDWPGPGVPGMRGNVEAFLKLDLSEAAKRAILWDNVARVLTP